LRVGIGRGNAWTWQQRHCTACGHAPELKAGM
jgi:hypothetical protein